MDDQNDNRAAAVTAEQPGSWLEPIPMQQRQFALLWRIAVAVFIAALLFERQFRNHAASEYYLWNVLILAAGIYLGVKAFLKRERRVFDGHILRFTPRQRIRRGAPWLLSGVAMLAFVWWVQISSDQFADYWWYAWPALLPIVVSVGLFMLKEQQVPSAAAEAETVKLTAAQQELARQREEKINAFLDRGPVRYVGAAGLLYLAYWFASESTAKNSGWVAAGCVLFALVCARELSVWLLGLGFVAVIAWALFAGIAALPVSVAVIIGALIIASAVGKK